MKLMRSSSPVAARQDVERLFERFFNAPMWPFTPGKNAVEGLWEPPLDFSETSKEYVVRLEVPGVTRDDLEVGLEGNLLTLSGRRELNKREKGEDFLWEERAEGRFVRTLRLPGPVENAKVDASYDNGVLTVRLPKAERDQKSRIVVK